MYKSIKIAIFTIGLVRLFEMVYAFLSLVLEFCKH